MKLDDSIDLFAVIVSITSLCFTLYLGGLANRSKVLFEVFNEFRSAKFDEVRARGTFPLPAEDTINSEAKFEPYREYSYFLNHIGLLLNKGYVNIDEIYQLAGTSIITTWQLIGPYILAVREQAKLEPAETNRTAHYQFHFEYLVARLLKHRAKGNRIIEQLMVKSAKSIRKHSFNTL
jgi:hypothetical protein